MPVHNGKPYLEEAVKSILSQTYRDFELIAVDDASSDNSFNVLEKYAKKDIRIKIIKNEKNIGLTKSLIKAASIAKGSYIARQDADDISLPKRLEKQIDFLSHNPSYGAIGTRAGIINKDGKFIKKADVPMTWFMTKLILKFGNCFLHGSMMMRKEDYDNAGGYRNNFYFGQDFDLWLRISNKKKMKNLGERLYLWRTTGANISSLKTDVQFKSGALALYDYRYNTGLKLDDSFDINSFITALSREERRKYDICLRDLCLRHGNTTMAKENLSHSLLNNVLIMLTDVAFSVIRISRR